ncbi:MAG: hypothetical protein OXC48_00600 [Endozoicomonadaceae bacterium]|nr:hypothetical protein [Endozoicomonadaceae bacterium]
MENKQVTACTTIAWVRLTFATQAMCKTSVAMGQQKRLLRTLSCRPDQK